MSQPLPSQPRLQRRFGRHRGFPAIASALRIARALFVSQYALMLEFRAEILHWALSGLMPLLMFSLWSGAPAGAAADRGEHLSDPLGRPDRAGRYRLRRDDGSIISFTHEPPDAARDGALVPWRRQFESWSLTARRLAPGAIFEMPIPDQARGATCRPEGLSRLSARQVLVAICAVELAGPLGNTGQEARIAIAGRVAIDVPTGMIAAQGYAARIETFNGGRSNGVVVLPSRHWLE
jgi:hypothetical protein